MNQLEVVKVLLKHGSNLSYADGKGRTALHHCIKAEGCCCLSFFLQQQDLDMTIMDKEGFTIWHLAAIAHNTQALTILLNRPEWKEFLNRLARGEVRPITPCASERGSVEAVMLLLDAGCNISETDHSGCSSLHHAAKAGSPDLVRLLSDRGPDARTLANDGSSIIHYAVMSGSSELNVILDILLDNGLNPFTGRKDRTTPIELLVAADDCGVGT